MVQVRVTQRCFVGNSLREVGEVFDYDGEPSPHCLFYIEDEKPAKKPDASKAVKKKPATKPPSE